MKINWNNLRSSPCPKCDRKGLHYADHPHAFGYKDYDRSVCRFCKARFKKVYRVAPQEPPAK